MIDMNTINMTSADNIRTFYFTLPNETTCKIRCFYERTMANEVMFFASDIYNLLDSLPQMFTHISYRKDKTDENPYHLFYNVVYPDKKVRRIYTVLDSMIFLYFSEMNVSNQIAKNFLEFLTNVVKPRTFSYIDCVCRRFGVL